MKSSSKLLLYPCGNLAKETIPNEMGKAGKSFSY